MKVDRRCPRCREYLYHWVITPKTDDEDLQRLRFECWPSEKIPATVEIQCANGRCVHSWTGRLTRSERGFDD